VIEGTIPALITPFDRSGDVDLDSMRRHIEWLAERSVTTVSPLGSTGEGPSLTFEERRLVIEHVAPHVQIVAGTACTSLRETIALSRAAVAAGATALLIAPPSYYAPDERGVHEYFRRLFDELPSAARVILYHIPIYSGVAVTSGLLRSLRDEYGPVLLGVKDSGGDFDHTRDWVREFPDLLVLNGADRTAAAHYAAGGRGTLTMLANVFPDRLERIRAGTDGDPWEDQTFLADLREVIRGMPEIAAVKHLVHRLAGLPLSPVRPPLRDLDRDEARRLDARL
jgi:4-hydroxy-tetrahydrodipicolinate synthase